MVAKREHAKNLVPLLGSALAEADMLVHAGATEGRALPEMLDRDLAELLAREPGLFDALSAFLSDIEKPRLDAIAVTAGPGPRAGALGRREFREGARLGLEPAARFP